MNDEARRSNDGEMTKSETPRDEFDDAFRNDATARMICEEPEAIRVYDLKNVRHDSVKQ